MCLDTWDYLAVTNAISTVVQKMYFIIDICLKLRDGFGVIRKERLLDINQDGLCSFLLP